MASRTTVAESALLPVRASRAPLTLPRTALPALLAAVLAGADLARLRRAGYDPFAPRVAASDPWRSWRLTLAAATARF